MKKNSYLCRLTLLGAMLLGPQPLLAQDDILDIYRLAQEHDPQIRAAEAGLQAARTASPQARALLLPNIGLSAETSDISYESSSTGSSDYNDNGYSLSLRQPVFHYEYYAQLRVADASIGAAQAQFSAEQQALILRVAQAYFNTLGARDTLGFARAEKDAIARQLEQAQKRFEVGLIAITDVHEAQAAYDLAIAQELAAENGVASATEALTEITGRHHAQLALLSEEMPMLTPEPANLEQWTTTALQQNWLLKAAEFNRDAAREQIKLRRSGHYPTLDMVANHADSSVGGGISGSRETETDSISLQFNLPIYQGGLVTQQTREAVYLHEQAREETELQRRTVLRTTRDAYRGILTDISRVKALMQAIISTRSALDATEAGFEVGTRTIVDVLASQRELYRAQRDYAQARYDYLLNTLRLKQAAGTLSPEDLQHINRWLQ